MAGFPTAAAHVQARCGRLGYRSPAVARVARAVPARSVLFEQNRQRTTPTTTACPSRMRAVHCAQVRRRSYCTSVQTIFPEVDQTVEPSPLPSMVGAPFARLLANLVVMGTGVLGRAFVEAYKQALQSARRQSAP